jgi:hypothetical protein
MDVGRHEAALRKAYNQLADARIASAKAYNGPWRARSSAQIDEARRALAAAEADVQKAVDALCDLLTRMEAP